jgi:hypothetical protein
MLAEFVTLAMVGLGWILLKFRIQGLISQIAPCSEP